MDKSSLSPLHVILSLRERVTFSRWFVAGWENIQDLSLHFSEKDALKFLKHQSHFPDILRNSHSPVNSALHTLRKLRGEEAAGRG